MWHSFRWSTLRTVGSVSYISGGQSSFHCLFPSQRLQHQYPDAYCHALSERPLCGFYHARCTYHRRHVPTRETRNGAGSDGLRSIDRPVFGPTIGGQIAQSLGWRWMFWLLAIWTGVIEVGFLTLFGETYKVTILRRKARLLRKSTGSELLKPVVDRPSGAKSLFQRTIIRLCRMLILYPVIAILALYVSLVFAYLYILLTNITFVFEEQYGFSTSSASLIYIGLGKLSQPTHCRFSISYFFIALAYECHQPYRCWHDDRCILLPLCT